jgi:hypothetical protein
MAKAEPHSITIDSITPAERAASLRQILNNFADTANELQYQLALRDQTIRTLQKERDNARERLARNGSAKSRLKAAKGRAR